MNKKTLLISIIISINIHLLIFLLFLNSENYGPKNYKKENFEFKVSFEKEKIKVNLKNNDISISNYKTKYSMPDYVNNLTISNEYIENIINFEKFKDNEAILLNSEEFEFSNEIDVTFKAKIYINEKGIVEDIVIENTNIEDEKLKELKLIIGKFKFKPAIKNGKGIPSTKEIAF
ncbi:MULTISPECIES: hypothetical protein [Deefgea]|uniref:TonB C-terminal domain-containing protein n=1 Tax=Deefgea chitinilytica TaxID=570276 RepID=A0ABS2CFF3_9NEIS|nr:MULTISPECIES: hypothetical protein [Deefgea]MBM5572880.1 hypothetical protein [Deefgea chitinilytica]MBM9890117.1 hypothetical protein [Deefgea sp. CFH1-16]